MTKATEVLHGMTEAAPKMGENILDRIAETIKRLKILEKEGKKAGKHKAGNGLMTPKEAQKVEGKVQELLQELNKHIVDF